MEIRTVKEEVIVGGSEIGRGVEVRGYEVFKVRVRIRLIWELRKKGRGKRVHLLEEIGMAVRTTRRISRG